MMRGICDKKVSMKAFVSTYSLYWLTNFGGHLRGRAIHRKACQLNNVCGTAYQNFGFYMKGQRNNVTNVLYPSFVSHLPVLTSYFNHLFLVELFCGHHWIGSENLFHDTFYSTGIEGYEKEFNQLLEYKICRRT